MYNEEAGLKQPIAELRSQAFGQTIKIMIKTTSTDTAQPDDCHIVAIGASAGGLNAFRELFEHLSDDTGLAFVVLQHQAPGHTSLLPSLLAGMTAMPVQQASEGVVIEPDHVYVLPPGQPLDLQERRFRPHQPTDAEKPFLPIDTFFQHLAELEESRAIGVILSGAASDGALGLKAIKAAGGITFAQDEDSAEHASMPKIAAATGCVDFVRKPADIAWELNRIARHPLIRSVDDTDLLPDSSSDLDGIFTLLRRRTGNDFSQYKSTTVLRRLRRRLVMLRLENLKDYGSYLRQHKDELDALYQDLLINVTQFFRDPDIYHALLTEILPRLSQQRPEDVPLRIWIPACSSGEEVYSLSMTLMEYLTAQHSNRPVQIFGTDVDAGAIEQARRAIYAENKISSVPVDYQKRYFLRDAGGFRIHKRIRDPCVFSVQNVLKDPPFSRLDLICCRNLLIYLNQASQRQLLRLFHYVLRDGGYLLLGTSETIGSETELFDLENSRCKIYRKKTTSSQLAHDFSSRDHDAVPAATTTLSPPPRVRDPFHKADQAALQHYAPPGVLVNAQLEILQFRGKIGPYLEPIPGAASLNLMKLIRQELAVQLRIGLQRSLSENLPGRVEGLCFHHEDQEQQVDIQILPVHLEKNKKQHLLVFFETAPPAARQRSSRHQTETHHEDAEHIRMLEQKLTSSREYLQAIIEDQQAGNEELQSANEEVQSANEELQSINEELETAKEEVQSTNEELATVNDELEQRNGDLARANNDLLNLTNSINLPLVMLDDKLHIRQFTPAARQMLNLIDGDLGRSIRDLRPAIDYDQLDELIPRVIDTMNAEELEVHDLQGRAYSMRVRPYKTLDNRIEGVVIAFIDMSDSRELQLARAVLAAQQQAPMALSLDNDRLLVLDLEGRLRAWNRAAASGFHGEHPGAPPVSLADLLPGEQHEALRQQLARVAREGISITAMHTRLDAAGKRQAMQTTLALLLDEKSQPSGFLVMDHPAEHPLDPP